MMVWIPLVAIVLIVILGIAWKILRRRKLGAGAKGVLAREWQHAASQTDPHRRLLEADSVIDHLLKELGYTGSMGDKLKGAAKIIPGLNDVWSAHKLRNRIAHEPGIALSDVEVQRAMKAFERVLRKFA